MFFIETSTQTLLFQANLVQEFAQLVKELMQTATHASEQTAIINSPGS